jgi:uncharacterized protein (TIGR03437 family)
VAPGELVTLFGSNLGPRSAQFPSVSAQGIVDTIAGGARVLFDGTPAPMVYALTGQVSVVVPFSVQGRSSTQVQAEYLGLRSDPVTIVVAAAAPAIFTLDKSGRGGGAILNQNLTVNSSDNPATRGSTIVIYATGGGAFPGAIDGRLAQPPLQQLRQLSVRIGGAIAQTTYAGEAPGIIEGALQINATVPPTVSSGAAVPIEIAIGNATSQAGVTVAIR